MLSSLIISTYNWPKALDLVLYSILNQVVLVDEIIIADDGSKDDTKKIIEEYRKKFQIELVHVWHKDQGFRKAIILNKAFKIAKGDYIIQIDGDILLHKFFIKNHLDNAARGFFLHGGRVFLNQETTIKCLKYRTINFNIFSKGILNRLNTLYLPSLSFLFNYKSSSLNKTRGCNFSCWQEDFTLVNGYNEEMVGWGLEDTELSARMLNNNIYKKRLKFIAITYHLDHPTQNKDGFNVNKAILNDVINLKIKKCLKGLNENRNENRNEIS